MKKIIPFAVGSIFLALSSSVWSCSSDFSCGIGYTCVKAPLKSRGECMKTVNEYGTRQYNMPDLDSVGPNMKMGGQCDFSTDCPIGFKCDRSLKACIKR